MKNQKLFQVYATGQPVLLEVDFEKAEKAVLSLYANQQNRVNHADSIPNSPQRHGRFLTSSLFQ
jgi:hypothetical protein